MKRDHLPGSRRHEMEEWEVTEAYIFWFCSLKERCQRKNFVFNNGKMTFRNASNGYFWVPPETCGSPNANWREMSLLFKHRVKMSRSALVVGVGTQTSNHTRLWFVKLPPKWWWEAISSFRGSRVRMFKHEGESAHRGSFSIRYTQLILSDFEYPLCMDVLFFGYNVNFIQRKVRKAYFYQQYCLIFLTNYGEIVQKYLFSE